MLQCVLWSNDLRWQVRCTDVWVCAPKMSLSQVASQRHPYFQSAQCIGVPDHAV